MPVAARLEDPIQHSNALTGLLAGALVGAAFGVFVVATGGAGLVVGAAIIGGAVATGAGIGEVMGSLSISGGTITGAIATGSGNTSINSLLAARATNDSVTCRGTPPIYIPAHDGKRVAQGSATVTINGMPAARVGDKIECGSKIQSGSSNVLIGGGTVTTLDIDSEVPGYIHAALFVVGLASAVILAGPVVAICGTIGSMVGGDLATQAAASLGLSEDWQKIAGLGGSLLGGWLGTKGGGMLGKIEPIANFERGMMRPVLENAPGYRNDIAAMKGESPTQIEARTQVATEFYARNGQTWDPTLNGGAGGYRSMTPAEINSNMRGIDMNKPVEVVNAPDRLNSWQAPGGRQGNYYADPQYTPNQLGIGDYGTSPGGAVGFKEATQYAVDPNTPALRSTSGPIVDDWSVRGTNQSTTGGGVQYYIPDKSAATPIAGSNAPISPGQMNPNGPIPGAPATPPTTSGAPVVSVNPAIPNPGPGSGYEAPFNPYNAGTLGGGAATGAGINANNGLGKP
jgi:uncharacterized Zn-binding protein involved in type VI secretion